MMPWRIRVRYGAGDGLVFFQDYVALLPGRYWTKRGAWREADRWKNNWEARRRNPRTTVLVDVVHRRELEDG
jgi:hypothetical protein